MEKKKILIIDDDVALLEELMEMLKLSGYEPVSVSDTSLIFETTLKVNPDVILLDLKLGGLNGFQVADRITQSRLFENVPIIAMTGYFTDKAHVTLMNSCGMKYCIIKPFDSFDVITKIETALAESFPEEIKIKQKSYIKLPID